MKKNVVAKILQRGFFGASQSTLGAVGIGANRPRWRQRLQRGFFGAIQSTLGAAGVGANRLQLRQRLQRGFFGIDSYSSGAAGLGAMLMFAAAIISFLLVCEFYYVFSVKQSIDTELSRAANIAVDMAMSDAHRQDRLSEMDAGAAYDSFLDYLYNDMSLTSRLEARSQKGEVIYSLEMKSVEIESSPPGLRATATVTLRPAFIGRAIPVPIRFSVRCSSANRRKD